MARKKLVRTTSSAMATSKAVARKTTKKTVAKRGAGVPKATKVTPIDKLEADFADISTKLLATLKKEIAATTQKQEKLKKIEAKLMAQVNKSTMKIKQLSKAKSLTTVKRKQIAATKKTTADLMKQQAAVKSDMDMLTKALTELKMKEKKTTARVKEISRFEKEWSKKNKPLKSKKAMKVKKSAKSKKAIAKSKPEIKITESPVTESNVIEMDSTIDRTIEKVAS